LPTDHRKIEQGFFPAAHALVAECVALFPATLALRLHGAMMKNAYETN
jgi:hypothetical protein